MVNGSTATNLQNMKNDLNDIVRRIEKLEKEVFKSKNIKEKKPVNKTGNNSLGDRIIGLRDSGFFKQPKTGQEVHKKLQSAYACEYDRVAMALLRLLNRKLLRVTSKKVGNKKLKAYVW